MSGINKERGVMVKSCMVDSGNYSGKGIHSILVCHSFIDQNLSLTINIHPSSLTACYLMGQGWDCDVGTSNEEGEQLLTQREYKLQCFFECHFFIIFHSFFYLSLVYYPSGSD